MELRKVNTKLVTHKSNLVIFSTNPTGKTTIKMVNNSWRGGYLEDRKINKKALKRLKRTNILLTCDGIPFRSLRVPKAVQNYEPLLDGTLRKDGFGELIAL